MQNFRMFLRYLAATTCLILSTAVNPSLTFAQWATTPTIDNVITNAPGYQAGPIMVTDADRGAIIAYQSKIDNNHPSTLYVQRIDKLGYLRWGTTGAAICSTMYRYDTKFAMTHDLAGGAFIVWTDERLSPRYKIFAQHIDSNGVALWQDQGVVVSDTAHTWSDSEPQIVRDDSGGVFVVFHRSGYGYKYISAQRILTNGTRHWTPADKDVTPPGARDDRHLKIVRDGSGVVVVWRGSGSGYPTLAQRIDQDGNNVWTAPKTVASPGTQSDFTIAPGDSIPGGINSMVAVAWSSDGTNKIYAQAIDTAGNSLWGTEPVAVCTIAGNHSNVRIINDLIQIGDSSSYYITWVDGRRSGVNNDIRAQRLNPTGVPQWITDGMLISDKPNLFSSSSITDFSDGSVVIASYDGRAEGAGIYAHRIARDGTKLWDTSGVHISTRTSVPVLHTTSYILSESGVIFAITGVGAGGYVDNIYAKMVNRDGLFPSSITSVSMLNSWNLISVPLVVSDFRKSVLFPTSVSSSFAYFPPPTGYAPKETLRTGVGYWLKFPSAQEVQLEGIAKTIDTVSVSAGWNMIGTIAYPALTADVTSISPVVIQSSFFGFEGVLGYLTEDTLKPGRGYWVKVNQGGNLIIRRSTNIPVASNASRKNNLFGIAVTEGLSKLIWKDRAGGERILLFSSAQKKIKLDQFDLPPQPPAGIFDVRFKSQRSVETVSAALSEAVQEFPISISVTKFPLVISWDVLKEDEESVLELLVLGGKQKQIPLKETGEVVINDNNILAVTLKLTSSKANEIPKEFALHQNYPNPFNPATTIKYDLPRDAWVTLKIYNALGQEVATLVDGMQEAGYKSVEWNTVSGSKVFSSGVYYYRLVSGEFTSMKKLMLVK